MRWGSPPGSAAASEQRRIASMAAPRCTTVAEVMLNDGETLSCAEKRNGSGQYVIRAGSGELGEACAACSAVVHQHASGGRRRPACNNMLPVMRGRADTCTARLAAVLDQASISGSSEEPGRCGRAMITLYPGRRERRNVTGAAALLEIEGTGWLLLDSRTRPSGARATVTLRKPCGGVLRPLRRPP